MICGSRIWIQPSNAVFKLTDPLYLRFNNNNKKNGNTKLFFYLNLSLREISAIIFYKRHIETEYTIFVVMACNSEKLYCYIREIYPSLCSLLSDSQALENKSHKTYTTQNILLINGNFMVVCDVILCFV